MSLTHSPQVTPVPGNPELQLTPLRTHEKDGFSSTLMTTPVHLGTHMDAPYHFVRNGRTIDQIPVSTFFTRAYLCDIRERVRPRNEITMADLEICGVPSPEELAGKALILYSGWAQEMWEHADFYTNNPCLAEETSRWLAETGLVMLGVDFAVDAETPYPNHQILLGASVLLVENLVNLDQIGADEFDLIALPVKIAGGDGGLTRAVAVLKA
ncbi:MAG: cyclase family protein [Candidatus Bipolaricaulia bacterium]